MKILYLANKTVDAVLQTTTENEIAKAICASGHQISTIALYRENKEGFDGFSSLKFIHNRNNSFFIKLYAHFKYLVEMCKGKADIVLIPYHLAHLIPMALLLRVWRKRPAFVIDIRSVPVERLDNLGAIIANLRYLASLRIANYFCDGFTVITPMLGDLVSKEVSRFKGNMGVWGSGVNLSHFSADKQVDSAVIREKLKLNGKKVVLYHGVLTEDRGIQNVIRAMDILRDRHKDLVFLLVGDGKADAELKSLKEEMDLGDRVIFTGKVPYADIPMYVRCADFGILPFPDITWWSVSSPIKLMEYLAMGVPVLATDIDANRYVLSRTDGGMLLKNSTPEAIAKGISKALDSTFEMPSKELLERTISWNEQSRLLLAYLGQVLRAHEAKNG